MFREADVFFVLDDATAGRAGVRAGQLSDTHIKEEARTLWRPVYDVALRSRGIEESLSNVPRGHRGAGAVFKKELHLGVAFEAGRDVPDAFTTIQRVAPCANVAWAPAIGGGDGACSRGVVRDAETRGVCVDDGWALMSRRAADAYFSEASGPRGIHKQRTATRRTAPSAAWGVPLFRAGVRAGSVNIDLHLERPETVGGRAYAATAKRVDAVGGGRGHRN